MGIINMWETGFFHCIIKFSNPFVSFSFWIPFIMSYLIQGIFMKKSSSFWMRHSLIFLGMIGVIIGECFCFVITGWDLLLYMYLEYIFMALLLGSLSSLLINKFRRSLNV